jgi:glycine/D-amino acid oxidase-like deaminating enzyme
MGCAIAYAFAASGVKVALFEAGRIAQQEAARGLGMAIHEPDNDFHKLAAQHGVRDSRHVYQVSRRGSLEYATALKRLGIECGLQIRSAIHFSSTPEGQHRLEKEYAARREAGLEVASLKGAALLKQTGVSGFGLLTHGNVSVDPYRAALGLARAAGARGAAIFERSAVTRVRPLRKTVEIKTGSGVITASKVVMATGFPTDGFRPLRRRFSQCQSYVVLTPELPAGIRREMTNPELILRDTHAPDHRLHWFGNRVLFSGADQPAVPERQKERAMIQRTGQLMYELSVLRPAISGVMPEYSWELTYSRTIDGVPYFGPHRNYPHHYFAYGAGQAGVGLSFAAARIILRHYSGAPDKADEPFSFTRIRE